MSLQIKTAGGRTMFSPGDEVELLVSWNLPSPPDALEVRFVWHTAGKGDTDMSVAKTIAIENPGSSGQQRLAAILPRSPYSFSGKLISVLWGIELVAIPEEEQSARLDITIGPRGREVLLLSGE